MIADAVLVYPEDQEDGHVRSLYRFVELDRNTMPVHALATKLARYEQLHSYRPRPKNAGSSVGLFWETRYPVFPEVLLVLDNGTDRQLHRRRFMALDMAARRTRYRSVEVFACLLSDLQAEGPYASIFTTAGEPGRSVDWDGRATPGENEEDGEAA